MNSDILPRIQSIIGKGNLGAIILPLNASTDAAAASIALYLSLVKTGKSVSIGASNPVNLDLIGTDKIQNVLVSTGDNLVISFPYTDGSIDKVDYNIQGNFFNLIVAPRPGYQKLDPKQVKYSYTGGRLDFLVTVDAPSLNALGPIYNDNQPQFQGRDIINIDRHLTNSFFGTVNYVEKTVSSISELVFKLLKELRIEIDKDIATNLYAGIAAATNNFTSYSVTAETFQAIAELLRLGAAKKTMKNQPQPSPISFPQTTPRMTPPSFPSQMNSIQDSTPIEQVEKEKQPEGSAPSDWLKPKIFRGGGLV